MSGTRWLEVTDTFDPKGTQRGIHTVDADALGCCVIFGQRIDGFSYAARAGC